MTPDLGTSALIFLGGAVAFKPIGWIIEKVAGTYFDEHVGRRLPGTSSQLRLVERLSDKLEEALREFQAVCELTYRLIKERDELLLENLDLKRKLYALEKPHEPDLRQIDTQ